MILPWWSTRYANSTPAAAMLLDLGLLQGQVLVADQDGVVVARDVQVLDGLVGAGVFGGPDGDLGDSAWRCSSLLG